MIAVTVLYSLLFASLGWMMPAADTHLERRDVSPELLTSFTLFSEYSAAATCAKNFDPIFHGPKVVCDPGVCPVLEKTDTTILTGFKGHDPGDTTGFIAVDNTNELIVLAFRGSRTERNWRTDLEYHQVPIDGICQGCQVHSGYYYAEGNISQYIMPLVNEAAAKYPEYGIVFTGHSLGGALATLAAVFEGTVANRPINLYTFGCPQLGNYSFAEFITATTALTGYRVTHFDDPVPRAFSSEAIVNQTWQYSTTSPEYWITSGNNVTVTTSDITVIEGIDNKSGNLGTTGTDITAHGWYIGSMKGCPIF